jgi:hypothetical protein
VLRFDDVLLLDSWCGRSVRGDDHEREGEGEQA